ncbi:protein RALF-like 34 [Sesamum alatum]|uniref:Protein RALF-like 34 n=1 Tax=Sesamum alatum TaxID=300844 RepID=A0AAE1XRG7_9LAMI|nr:protein RALF-like 34 [Sesamum alatum]
MDSAKHLLFSLTLLFTILVAAAQLADKSAFQISDDALDQWETGISFYNEELGEGVDDEATNGAPNRRSLFWKRVFHYYISYGALSANRVPCPPRSGRSYYTHNCYRARGPVHPYTRGCSAITRCRR